MRKLVIMLVGACWSVAASSQDLLQCLSPDVVESLLFPTTGDPVAVTATVPDELADFNAPAPFDWIGSIVADARKTAAFKTELPVEAALEAALSPLEASGWARLDSPRSSPTFLLADEGEPEGFATVCRNGETRQVSVRDAAGARYVNLSHESRSDSSCGSARRYDFAQLFGGLREHTPVLRFPAGTIRLDRGLGRGGTFSAGSRERSQVHDHVRSDSSAAGLLEHLGGQMIEQGWLADSSWSGRHGAGSAWSRRVDPDTRVVGTLNIVVLADQSYDVELRLRTVD